MKSFSFGKFEGINSSTTLNTWDYIRYSVIFSISGALFFWSSSSIFLRSEEFYSNSSRTSSPSILRVDIFLSTLVVRLSLYYTPSFFFSILFSSERTGGARVSFRFEFFTESLVFLSTISLSILSLSFTYADSYFSSV